MKFNLQNVKKFETLPCAAVCIIKSLAWVQCVLCMVGLGLLKNDKAVPNLSVLNYRFIRVLLDSLHVYHFGVVVCLCSILAHKSLTVLVFAAFRIQVAGTVST